MANRWAAARLRLRSEVRTRRAGMALLVAVVAIASGVTMAAAAGARRSDTAYARFRVWAHDPDLSASGCDCTNEQAIADFARLKGAPFVLDSVEMNYAELIPQLPDGTQASSFAFLPVIDVGNRLGREVPRVKVLHGRLPDPHAADEAGLGFVTAERFHLAVGDVLTLLAADPRRSPSVAGTVRIVGIYAAPGELPSASGPSESSFLLTSAFARTIPDLIQPMNDTVMVRLRPGASRSEAVAFIRSLGFDVNDAADLTSGIRKTIGIETIALVLLAAVVASVGLVVVGQMLRRQAAPAGDEGVTFAALGADRGDRLRVGFLRGAAVGLAGAALGGVIAIAMSPLFPVGIGRIADPDLGLHSDVIVLGLGAVLTLGATTALGLLSTITTTQRAAVARPGARPRGGDHAPARRPRWSACRSRCRAARARHRHAARVSLLSLVVVVVALAATSVTLASFDHLVARRDLAGATWQGVFLPPDPGDPASLTATIGAVRAVPGVEAATIGSWATTGGGSAPGVYVDGHLLAAQIFGDDGTIRPAVRRGRAPRALGEVALGSKTMAELGVKIGDAVDLSLEAGGRSAAVLSSAKSFWRHRSSSTSPRAQVRQRPCRRSPASDWHRIGR